MDQDVEQGLTAAIDRHWIPFETALANLMTIPGVARTTAATSSIDPATAPFRRNSIPPGSGSDSKSAASERMRSVSAASLPRDRKTAAVPGPSARSAATCTATR